MVIYLVTNLVNGKRYVGQTVHTARKRWIQHTSGAARGKVGRLFSAIRKHGKDNFSIETLVPNVASRDILNTLEIHFVHLYGSQDRHKGYNSSPGGGQCRIPLFGDANPMRRPEVAAMFTGDNSPMRRPEIRARYTGDKNFAKRPEVRAKISSAAMGNTNGTGNKGRVSTMLGKKMPESAKEKIRQARLRYWAKRKSQTAQ